MIRKHCGESVVDQHDGCISFGRRCVVCKRAFIQFKRRPLGVAAEKCLYHSTVKCYNHPHKQRQEAVW